MKQLIEFILNLLWTFGIKQPKTPAPAPIEPIIDEPDIDQDPEAECQDGCITDAEPVITNPIDTTKQIRTIPAAQKQNIRFVTAAGHDLHTPGKRSPEYTPGKRFYEYDSNYSFNVNVDAKAKSKGLRCYNLTPFTDRKTLSLIDRVTDFNTLMDKSASVPTLGIEIHSNAGPARSPENWINHKIQGIETWHYYDSPIGQWAAEIFQKHLISATGAKNRGIKSRKEKQFYWLRKTKAPCVLLEINFFNNYDDLVELKNPEYRNLVETAIVNAMLEINEFGFPEQPMSFAATTTPKKSLIGKDIKAVDELTGQIIEGLVTNQKGTQLTVLTKKGTPEIIDTINFVLTIAPTILMLIQQIGDMFKSWFGNPEKKAARQERRAARKLN